MKANKAIAEYDAADHQIWVTAPTVELYEVARRVPGARELKKQGRWLIPATPATVLRLSQAYQPYGGLLIDRPYRQYQEAVLSAVEQSSMALTGALPPIPITRLQPEGPWIHQLRAFWFAYPLEAAMLAVTMGGGKTKLAIDLLQNWNARTTLIISPLAAIEDAWIPQLKEWMVGKFNALALDSGSIAMRQEAAHAVMESHHSPRILLINHEAYWRAPFAEWACAQRWDLIINDESHREKSAGSKTSKYLNRLSARARRRLCLTGTPMPHSPLDVYGQYRFLDRGIYGQNHDDFLDEYAQRGGYMGREVIGYKNLRDLRTKFFSIGIQIDDSTQGLPKVVPLTHSVDLEPAARKLYNELDEEFTAELRKQTISADNAGVKLLRLHQIASGHVKNDKGKIMRVSEAKLHGLRDVLSDVDKKEPVVIFVRFKPELDAVRHLCLAADRDTYEISGRVNELQEWKHGGTGVLVAQIQAVKEGIDATLAAIGIFFSTGISLGDYLQCIKRLHRPPQKRMVRIIHIIAHATRDVTTLRSLKANREVIQDTLRDPKGEAESASPD